MVGDGGNPTNSHTLTRLSSLADANRQVFNIPGSRYNVAIMPSWITSFLLAIPLPTLWLLFGVPLLSRLFGVSMPLNPRKRRAVMLDPNQSLLQAVMLYGVLSWGVAMFLFTTSNRYFQWRLLHNPSDQLSVQAIVLGACTWIGGGALFGLLLGFDAGRQTKS